MRINFLPGKSLLLFLLAVIFSGCAQENQNPLGVEKLGGVPSIQEEFSVELDARGIVNGVFMPGDKQQAPYKYPVSYIGSWTIIPGNDYKKWYMITSDLPSSRIDINASVSRVIFDFWDYDFYSDPGVVSFELDGKSLGKFYLKRELEPGKKVLDYVVVTNKETVSTISMTLESGRAVLMGYIFVYPYLNNATTSKGISSTSGS